MPGLAEFLLGQTRTRVLSALLLHPEQALHVRELARATGASAGSLHRELRGLGEAGLLLRTEVGRQVHFQANVQSPVSAELASLLRKTAGVAGVPRVRVAARWKRLFCLMTFPGVPAKSRCSSSC